MSTMCVISSASSMLEGFRLVAICNVIIVVMQFGQLFQGTFAWGSQDVSDWLLRSNNR
jgi:hypothetical protein